MEKDKPKFFRWAFHNNITVFVVLLIFFLSRYFGYISVPDIKLVEGIMQYGTKSVFSWWLIIRFIVLAFVGYGVLRGLIYYFRFIMKDD